MALHDSLRELVQTRGAGVVDESEELRGALDDFLAEDEASLGELNLLVDAVRLGALRRVRDVLAHGADPEAAIRQAGAGLARDRGTDDPTRSCWALATLCYALDAIDEQLLDLFAVGGTPSAPASAPEPPSGPTAPGTADPHPTRMMSVDPADGAASVGPSVPAPPPVVAPSGSAPVEPAPPPAPLAQPPAQPPAPPAAPPTAYTPPAPPVAPAPPERRGRVGLVVLAVVVVLLAVAATGWWLLRDDGDDATADDDRTSEAASSGTTTEPTDDPTTEPTDDPTTEPTDDPTDEVVAVGEEEIVAPFVIDGESHLFAVDADNDQVRQLTDDGGNELLPSVSPDRSTIAYQRGPRPFELWTVSASGGLTRAPLADEPACAHSGRPAWSTDASRVAIVCSGDDDVPDGIYLAEGDLSAPELVLSGTGFAGAPTWIDDARFVYGVISPDGVRRLWLYDTASTAGSVIELSGLEGADLTHPDWSEDQQQLVFLVHPDPESEFGELWVTGPDLTDPQPLGGAYGHPAWAPTGDRLVVTTLVDGVEKLAVVRTADPLSPQVLETPDLPEDAEVGVPAWGTR
ncbi:TolB family protein [Nocardioides stalactiti]|uniref:TolB family protein n=1 Tax=Nocardioides stalactiti TaxID=2755356 RepID=UPI0016028978|nr:PD40 domain-containing protein [Nocardioides stalactiti]